MNNSKTKVIAFIGVMSALMFILLYLETYVFVALIPLAPPAVLSLSLAFTLCVFDDWKKMFIGGTILGCCSMLVAFAIANPVFIFPWISVLPRILAGMSAYGGTALIKKFTKNSQKKFAKEYLPYSVGAIFGTITNTVLVLGVMFAFKFIGIEDVVATFIAFNFPAEVIGSGILTPILTRVVKKVNIFHSEN